MTKPNIFRWATSELSQDAFFCWLAAWASPNLKAEHQALNQLAIDFIRLITNGKITDVNQITVKKQHHKIDIVLFVNQDHVIVIEDKVHTKNHSNQLERYKKVFENKTPKDKQHLVYLKTGDQSRYGSIRKQGYHVVIRKDLLPLLEKGIQNGVQHPFVLDFYQHLKSIEDRVQSYKTIPIHEKWQWDSWKGFYTELQKRLNDGSWGYISSYSGGFLGFWWLWLGKDLDGVNFQYYLQIEHGKFCFKLTLEKDDTSKRDKIRRHYRSLLYPKAREHNIPIKQNGRIGEYMTVAKLNYDFRQAQPDGTIDMDKTVEEIRRIERMLYDI